MSNFDLGAFFALIVSVAAWRAHALTVGGAVAAFLVGTCTYGSGGWPYGAVLLTFFVTSVGLSRVGRARKKRLVDIGKTGARDASQVLANGGVATVCALCAWYFHSPAWAAAFAGAYAAATADTWGTEIGTLARRTPVSILTLRPIATGLSGGVTLPGTAAECAGALVLGLAAAGLAVAPWWPVAVAGIAGALVDSLLGGSLQTLRWCPQCRRTCETEPHACGANTEIVRGAAWFTNDGVNFACTVTGALVAYGLTAALGR